MSRISPVLVAAPLWIAVLSMAPVEGQSTDSHAPLGTNITRCIDWSTELQFVDALKASRPWVSGTPGNARLGVREVQNDGRALDLDAQGWVRSLLPDKVARTLMFGNRNMHAPVGQYVVLYEGEGTMQFAGGARVLERSPGQIVLDYDETRGPLIMNLTSVDPGNYLRNIRVRMPVDAGPCEIFNPAFLDSIRGYQVIRFKNWMVGDNWGVMSTAASEQRSWSNRPRPSDARWSVKGVPIEVIAMLSNRLGADAWLSVHHLADDEYVRQLALKAFSHLNPDRKVYVEHSNEIWNGLYPQATYCREQGVALGLSTDPYEAQIRFHARRTRQIAAIFEEVFPPDRLVRVLGSFSVNPWTTDRGLSFEDVRDHVDAVAIAPYFGGRLAHPDEEARVEAMSLDNLFLDLETVHLPRVKADVIAQVATASRYGKSIVAYEAGQHLAGPVQDNATINALFDAANRDPRMGALYTRYLQDWSDAGAGLMAHFLNCAASNRDGRFGSLEYLGQPRAMAPKYDALHAWLEASY